MKLSDTTLGILKNFSSINQSILIREGDVLRTISPQKNIMAKAKISESFPQEFAIYNLNRFIGVLGLFKNGGADLSFTDKFVNLSDGNNSVQYTYAHPELVVAAPDKDITLPSIDVEFNLSAEDLNNIQTAANVMSLPVISIVGDSGKLSLVANDPKVKDSSDRYSIALGNTNVDCNVEFKTENIKCVSDNYKVTVSSQKISCFEGENGITYWIAAEASSTFNS